MGPGLSQDWAIPWKPSFHTVSVSSVTHSPPPTTLTPRMRLPSTENMAQSFQEELNFRIHQLCVCFSPFPQKCLIQHCNTTEKKKMTGCPDQSLAASGKEISYGTETLSNDKCQKHF